MTYTVLVKASNPPTRIPARLESCYPAVTSLDWVAVLEKQLLYDFEDYCIVAIDNEDECDHNLYKSL